MPAEADKTAMNFGSGSAKAWRDIWGAGQGVGLMDDVPSVAEMVARLKAEYDARAPVWRCKLARQAQKLRGPEPVGAVCIAD
jgi:NAD(P)H-dependent flavin oxidoreductase YrpB (nitropropane dioxygenase family)